MHAARWREREDHLENAKIRRSALVRTAGVLRPPAKAGTSRKSVSAGLGDGA
jgi:hypothetical protein